MVIDHAHITASSTQACLGVTLLPGGETIARYLEWEQSEYEWKKKNEINTQSCHWQL